MKGQVSILALASQAAAYALPLDARVPPSESIVGGEQANIQDFPYQVSVQKNNSAWCGGTIVSSRYIVTAAHCVLTGSNPTSLYSILVGSDDIKQGTRYKLASVVSHPKFEFSTVDYDIAILKTTTDIEFSSAVKALPVTDSTVPSGVSARVSGWGSTSYGGPYPTKLRYVDVPTISYDDCSAQYDGAITSRMTCAGSPEGGKSVCHGDSGGPLVYGGKLVGIVSWGAGGGCALPNAAGIYADVGNSEIRQFVKQQTGI